MWDHVSLRVPRSIHRPMHRSIYRSLLDRLSTDTRPTCRSTDVLVQLPLLSAEVSTVTISVAYRSTTGGISVNYRRNVGRVSFDSRARVDHVYLRHPSVDISADISVDYQHPLSTEYRSTFRPSIGRHIGR